MDKRLCTSADVLNKLTLPKANVRWHSADLLSDRKPLVSDNLPSPIHSSDNDSDVGSSVQTVTEENPEFQGTAQRLLQPENFQSKSWSLPMLDVEEFFIPDDMGFPDPKMSKSLSALAANNDTVNTTVTDAIDEALQDLDLLDSEDDEPLEVTLKLGDRSSMAVEEYVPPNQYWFLTPTLDELDV